MDNRRKTVFALIALILLLFLGLGLIFKSNRSLKEKVKNNTLTIETIESERLNLEKTIEQLKGKLKENYKETETLYQIVKEAKKEIEKKEKELYTLRNFSVKELKTKNAELQRLLGKVNAEIEKVTQEKNQAATTLNELSFRVKVLEEKNQQLSNENYALKQLASDNYRLEAVRNNGKLVVRAPRTQQLKVFFDLPKSDAAYNVGFTVITPSKKEYQSNQKDIAEVKQTVSTDSTQRFELTFKPKEKLEKGIFVFRISNNNFHVGNAEVRLR